MNLVDSSGWLEYFTDGKNAAFFATPLDTIESVIVPTICILDVFKRTLQQRGEDEALKVIAVMRQGSLVDLDFSLALAAVALGHQLKLPLADSIILATARAHDAILWTQDADFKGIDGVRYVEKH